MKKIVKILFILLLFTAFKVNAEGCGKYIREACGSTCQPMDDFDYGDYTITVDGVECPDEYYGYWVSTGGADYIIFSVTGDDTYVETLSPPGSGVFYDHYKKYAKPVLSDKYKDIISCRQTDYNYISECGCMPAALTDLTSRLYMLIKIAAPALLLIIGGFDLVKAMSAQDESAINKARQKLVKKFIAAAAVFLIFTLVQFIVSTLANDSRTTMTCVDYLLNGYVA